jgi:ketosteroid isomerase-like protein
MLSRRGLSWLPLAAAAEAQSLPGMEAKAILAVLSGQQDAWNRGDIAAFMQGYENSNDTTFVGSTGVVRGYQPVLERYLKRYPTRDAMGQLTFSELEVHALGAEHAWVLGKFNLVRNEAGGGNANGRFTLLFKKSQAQWKVIVDHTS